MSSGSINAAPSALDTGGSATCPNGTVVWGGGVTFVGGVSGPDFTVNTSTAAASSGWTTRVNNTGTTTVQFTVHAICANKPKGYELVFQTVDNPANSESHATAVCPSPKVVLGGGSLSTSDEAAAVLTNAWPATPAKFTGYTYNGTASDAQLTVTAVCGLKPTGYAVASVSSSVDAGYSLIDGVACRAGTSAVGGGVRTVGHSRLVQVGGSIDQGAFGWSLNVNNDTPSQQTVEGYVICAA